LRRYAKNGEFLTPDIAFQEAREHLPGILGERNIAIAPAMEMLDLLKQLVQRVEAETYSLHETAARDRIGRRDEDDRPVLAVALAFGCPIWTEDTDFFGCGVAIWTTDRVELYLTHIASHR